MKRHAMVLERNCLATTSVDVPVGGIGKPPLKHQIRMIHDLIVVSHLNEALYPSLDRKAKNDSQTTPKRGTWVIPFASFRPHVAQPGQTGSPAASERS